MLFRALECRSIRICFFSSSLVTYFIVFYLLPLRSIGSFVHIIEFMDYLLDDEERQVLFKALKWLLDNSKMSLRCHRISYSAEIAKIHAF